MSIDLEGLRALSSSEKLQVIELLCDDLDRSTDPIPLPLPDWVEREAVRRLEEMRDPTFGLTHEEAWRRIDSRNG